jgi:hypothetical protein
LNYTRFRNAAELRRIQSPLRRIEVAMESESRKKGDAAMKNVLWIVCGFCAAATGFLVWGGNRTPPVKLLAHRLEMAWADHHTVVETT